MNETPTPPEGYSFIPRAYLEAGNPLPEDALWRTSYQYQDDSWSRCPLLNRILTERIISEFVFATAQPLPCFQKGGDEPCPPLSTINTPGSSAPTEVQPLSAEQEFEKLFPVPESEKKRIFRFQSPDQGPEQPCTNHFSDGSKIFPNRDCCKGPERVAPEPTAEQRIERQPGTQDLGSICGPHKGDKLSREFVQDVYRDVAHQASKVFVLRKQLDAIAEALRPLVPDVDPSTAAMAATLAVKRIAELERELTIERGESAETSRILHEQDEDVKRLTMERDEAQAERDKWKDAAFDGETEELVRAQLAASEKDRQWQPIETAPRDGAPILVLERGVVYHVKWGGDRHETWVFFQGIGFVDHATHWMPLPKAPDAAMKEAK